jgi:hypothetical protein
MVGVEAQELEETVRASTGVLVLNPASLGPRLVTEAEEQVEKTVAF